MSADDGPSVRTVSRGSVPGSPGGSAIDFPVSADPDGTITDPVGRVLRIRSSSDSPVVASAVPAA